MSKKTTKKVMLKDKDVPARKARNVIGGDAVKTVGSKVVAGGSQAAFLKIVITDVLVSSFNPHDSKD